MAYIVYCDDIPIHDLRGEALALIDPELTLEVNKAGEFKFKLPPNHEYYDLPRKMKSKIQVFQDGQEIFNGRPVQIKSDFYKRKQVVCEGQLAFLNDSVQRPAEYHDMTVRQYLQVLLESHNSQVDESRQFELGIITVKDSNDSLYRYTNMNSTMTELKEDLVDDLGGYLKVRNVYDSSGALEHRYLDYVTMDDYGVANTQVINFGENLLDFTRDIDMTDICTAIIPLGARLEESEFSALETRLTVESVNGGLDYIQVDEAVATYGFIVKTVTWDNVNTPSLLLSKGKRYLSDYQFENMVIEAQAIDLHYTDVDVEAFHLGDRIRVKSNPHGLDRYFPLTKMTIYLDKPGSNKITLGNETDITLSAKTNSVSSSVKSTADSIPVPSAIVKSAVEQATALITAATHGYVVTTADEQLIMDTNDVETATKVWRWNLNGLGYSKNGYKGTYDTAITMDGQIVGDRLVGGSVSAEKLDVNYKISVEKRITESMETAEENSNAYTDGSLKSYWTRAEVETAIKNTSDSILLSAKETATTYTDSQLKNYSTSAQIKVTTDAITTEVNKKLNSSELSTKIQQNASAVKIAWNNISKYIQFESGELRIYDSAVTSTQKLVSKFNYNGCHFYRDNYYVGKIGTNKLQSDSSKKGLVFDLENEAAYMSWSAKESSSASTYTTKWTYVQNNKGWGNYTAGELHAGCNINMHGYDLKNFNFDVGGITGTMNFVQILGVKSDGTVTSWSNGCTLQFKKGILIAGKWHKD